MKIGLKTRTMITEEEIETFEDKHLDCVNKRIRVTSTVTTPTKEPNRTLIISINSGGSSTLTYCTEVFCSL